MRNTIRTLLVLLAVVLAPLPLMGQQSPRGPDVRDFGRYTSGPVQMLLRNRGDLGLTEAQVTRLREIDREMDERNRPYVEQLVQIRRQLPERVREREMTAEQREAYRAHMRAAAPLFERIRENNMICMRQVGEILTADQKERVGHLIREKERNSDGDGDSRRRRDAGRN